MWEKPLLDWTRGPSRSIANSKGMLVPKPIVEFGNIEHGWAQVWLRHDESEFHAAVSYVNDGLGEFIRAVTCVCTERLPGAVSEWSNEPGYWIVSVRSRRYNGYIQLSVGYDRDDTTALSNIHEPMPEPDIHFRATYLDVELARDVVKAFCLLIEKYGADEYERRWSFPFPEPELETLREWLGSDDG
jgi:hypothetical protein